MRARLFAAWAVSLLGALAWACGSTSIEVSSPSAIKCQVSVANSINPPVPASGASGTLTVNTTRDCTWDTTSDAPWIVLAAPTSGQGSGSVSYRVSPNADPAQRRGTLDVNNTQVTLVQDPAPCRYAVTPTNATVSASGGTATISVDTVSACSWNAASQTAWIAIASAPTGAGAGTVTLAVAANPGAARTGTVTIGGQTVTVSQPDAAPCDVTLSAPGASFGANGSTGSVGVTAPGGCRWTATTSADWIVVTGGATGTGNGQVQFTVSDNTSTASRQAAIVVGGRAFTVSQAGVQQAPCTFAIAPASDDVAAEGGSGTVAVTAGGGCAWTAVSNDSWISIASGSSGSGSGTVRYSVAANGGAARTGTLTIAGKTFTVSQAAVACSFSIAPSSQSVGSSGGSGSFTVTAPAVCSWTASSTASWISITSGASGSGNGTIAFTVAANGGVARTGTIGVGGRTFTVTQSAACAFSIAPSSQAAAAAGGSGSIAVTADAGCGWTAASNAPWITITSGASGSGNGTVAFSVAANGGTARSGTLTIAGQTFTVNQAAAAPTCTFTLSSASANASASGGPGSVNVTASAGSCAWTATSGVNWVTVTAGASGTGNGTVSFSVAANTGGARSGTLTIAGQTFTVNQAAAPPPCTFTLAPTSDTVAAGGGSGTVRVTASAGTCAWTASSGSSWITITSGASGTGNGSVGYTVAANTGAARNGTITIAGTAFTVSQAAAPQMACTYDIDPKSASVPAAGGSTSVRVSASPSTCAWTADSAASWITVSSNASGTGDGTVGLRVDANGGNARTGTVAIAQHTFTVNQGKS